MTTNNVEPFSLEIKVETAKSAGPRSRNLLSAYVLGLGVIAAALFGAIPAVWEVVEYLRYRNAPGVGFVARWALVLFLISAVQVAYGVYLLQVPDWSSVGVVTILLLVLAGFYAVGLGLVLIASPSGWLVGPGGLQVADKLPGGQAALWCLCMISVQAIVAFFAGRLFVRWRRADGDDHQSMAGGKNSAIRSS